MAKKDAEKNPIDDLFDDPRTNEPVDGQDVPPSDDAVLKEALNALGEKSVEDKITRLRIELDEAKDLALRHQAELENYRKRVARQMEDERRYAGMPLVRDILPVWDNMGRALEAAEQSHDTSSLLEGLQMMSQQLLSALERNKCVRIESLNEPFDPNRHESITQQPSDEVPPNTVVLETQVGFMLYDRVVRPSQVIVSCKPPEPVEPDETEEK